MPVGEQGISVFPERNGRSGVRKPGGARWYKVIFRRGFGETWRKKRRTLAAFSALKPLQRNYFLLVPNNEEEKMGLSLFLKNGLFQNC